MNPERIVAIKQQALKAIASRANNPAAPGVSMVAVSPHEALEFLEALEEQMKAAQQESKT